MTTTEATKCCGGKSTACAQNKVENRSTYRPKFDMWYREGRVFLQGDLPGVAPEDLEIEYEDGTLTLRGSVVNRVPASGILRREYGVGDFQRQFTLGHEIDADSITAELEGGVLTLVLPLVGKAKPRRIDVAVS